MTAQELGRRERKKLATRAAVRDAALRLAVRHGVEHVTVEQIAAEADIALRTFFNHFSGKEEAVMGAVAAAAESFVAAFRARPRTESVLRAVREAVIEVFDADDEASRGLVEAQRLLRSSRSLVPQQLAVLAAQEAALAAVVAERVADRADPAARPDPVYPRVCAAAVLAALRVVLERWLDRSTGPDDTPPSALLRAEIDQAFTELARGLDRPGGPAGAGDPATT